MHTPPPPNARRRSETVCLFFFFFLVDFLGYTPGAHDAWEAGHFCFPSWAGSVVERYPPLPLAGNGLACMAATDRARPGLGSFFGFPFLSHGCMVTALMTDTSPPSRPSNHQPRPPHLLDTLLFTSLMPKPPVSPTLLRLDVGLAHTNHLSSTGNQKRTDGRRSQGRKRGESEGGDIRFACQRRRRRTRRDCVPLRQAFFSSVPRSDGRQPMTSSPARQAWSRPGQTLAVDKKGPGPKEGRVCKTMDEGMMG